MQTFNVQNRQDGKTLYGHYWPAQTPTAFISLIHGLGEYSGRYAHMAAALNAQNISLAAIDLHGHGLTSGKRGVAANVELLHGDIQALLEYSTDQQSQNKGTNEDRSAIPHILMGHSMGGNLVLSYALAHPNLPLSRIIAQAPLIKVVDPISATLKLCVRLVTSLIPSFSVKAKLEPHKISTLIDEQDAYADDPLIHTYCGGKLALSLFEHGDRIMQMAPELSYDALITHGTADKLTSIEASRNFADKCPKAKFIAYENSGHEIHNDIHREQVYADIIAWVQHAQ